MIETMRKGEARDATGKSISSKTALLFSGHFADLESEYAAAQERLKSATYHLNDFNCTFSTFMDSCNNTEVFVSENPVELFEKVHFSMG